MSKVIVISVIVAAAVFASVTISVQKKAIEVPEVVAQDLAEIQMKICGNYALNYAMDQILSGKVPYEQGAFTQTFSADYQTNFNVTSGLIDSIKYIPNNTFDTLVVTSYVTTSYLGDNYSHQSFAGIGVEASGGEEQPPPVGPFTCAILSGDDMTFTGSGTTHCGEGNVHTNGYFKMTGSCKIEGNLSSCYRIWTTGSTKIFGDAYSPAWKGKSPGNVTGTAYTVTVPPIPIPVIDMTPFYQWAVDHGEYYTSTVQISGSQDIEPNGGLMWVNGYYMQSGSGDFIGGLIAKYEVQISGSGDHVKHPDHPYFPAIVSLEQGLQMSGSGKVHGLIYAPNGAIQKSGSGDVEGSMICGGKFKKSGSWNIMDYENSTPVPPGEGGGESNININIVYWQE